MNVMTVARSIGLVGDDRSAVSGTIDEATVLAAISDLAERDPDNDDLFADAAMRVQLARSAGVVHPEARSLMPRSTGGTAVQLRYRSEMADVFTDLAIDQTGTRLGQVAVANEQSAKTLQTLLAADTLQEDAYVPAVKDLPEFMSEQEFARRFTAVGSAAYNAMDKEIGDRIDRLPVMQQLQSLQ